MKIGQSDCRTGQELLLWQAQNSDHHGKLVIIQDTMKKIHHVVSNICARTNAQTDTRTARWRVFYSRPSQLKSWACENNLFLILEKSRFTYMNPPKLKESVLFAEF